MRIFDRQRERAQTNFFCAYREFLIFLGLFFIKYHFLQHIRTLFSLQKAVRHKPILQKSGLLTLITPQKEEKRGHNKDVCFDQSFSSRERVLQAVNGLRKDKNRGRHKLNRCSSLKRKNGLYEQQTGPERAKATEDNESADVAASKERAAFTGGRWA